MPKTVSNFDKNAVKVKKAVLKNKGEAFKETTRQVEGLIGFADVKGNILKDMKEFTRQAEAIRKGSQGERPVDINLEQFIKAKYGFGSVQAFYDTIGIDPTRMTVHQLSHMTDFDEGHRWLIPEVIRDAVRLGLRRNPIYPDLIAAEESVTQMKVTMPHVNMSDATPEIINENETIPVGEVSFGDRNVEVHTVGTGLKVSDKVQKYVSLNILSLYLQDSGVKLGLGLDTMAIDVLLNGEGQAGSYAAPVIGVESTGDFQYIDLLRAWLRMGRLGRLPSAMLSNEEPALEILQLSEFKGANYNNKKQNINIKTPIPQSQDYLVHGAMPAGNTIALLDKSSALLKLTAENLSVESERIVERKLSGTYATVTTGFAKLFRDAFLVIDSSLPFSGNGFPSFMDVGAAESVLLK